MSYLRTLLLLVFLLGLSLLVSAYTLLPSTSANISYSNNYVLLPSTSANITFDYVTTSASSCSAPLGGGAHWTIQGKDYCNITVNTGLGGYNITVNGTGRTTFTANVTGCKRFIVQNNATVIITGGAKAPCGA